ncbi:hypothetical protein V1523DRAFT_419127 [Lipomyces doorenjongii]
MQLAYNPKSIINEVSYSCPVKATPRLGATKCNDPSLSLRPFWRYSCNYSQPLRHCSLVVLTKRHPATQPAPVARLSSHVAGRKSGTPHGTTLEKKVELQRLLLCGKRVNTLTKRMPQVRHTGPDGQTGTRRTRSPRPSLSKAFLLTGTKISFRGHKFLAPLSCTFESHCTEPKWWRPLAETKTYCIIASSIKLHNSTSRAYGD